MVAGSACTGAVLSVDGSPRRPTSKERPPSVSGVGVESSLSRNRTRSGEPVTGSGQHLTELAVVVNDLGHDVPVVHRPPTTIHHTSEVLHRRVDLLKQRGFDNLANSPVDRFDYAIAASTRMDRV